MIDKFFCKACSYLVTKHTETDLTRRLDEKVWASRRHEKWRMEYMTLEERDQWSYVKI